MQTLNRELAFWFLLAYALKFRCCHGKWAPFMDESEQFDNTFCYLCDTGMST